MVTPPIFLYVSFGVKFSRGYVAEPLLHSYNTHNPQSFPQVFLCKTREWCHFPHFPLKIWRKKLGKSQGSGNTNDTQTDVFFSFCVDNRCRML